MITIDWPWSGIIVVIFVYLIIRFWQWDLEQIRKERNQTDD